MGEVARIATPYTREQLADALAVELGVAYPGAASRELSAMLLAQLFLETGNGAKMVGNNPGNLTANPDSYKGQWYRPTWWTDKNSKLYAKAHANPPTAPRAFRAYLSLEDGIADYLRLLGIPRYERLIEAARKGDPALFTQEIKASGYAPDVDPVKHTPTMVSLYNTALTYFERGDAVQEIEATDYSALGVALAGGLAIIGVKFILGRKR